jgi:excisionase family DNA binding protein
MKLTAFTSTVGAHSGVDHPDRPLLVNNVARRLCLSRREVRHLAQRGKLPAFKMGRKIWGFHKVNVDAYHAMREAQHADF